MARRPTTSTSSPATSAGTTSAAGRSSPWRTFPPADWDTRLDLEAAFRALPEEIQAVAVLCLLQERKQREAAKILGIGLPLVKYRLRRARELLAQSLGKEALP